MKSVNLSQHSFCFSVSPRRRSVSRRMFHERGLQAPRVPRPFRVEVGTRTREPRAYSALALNFIDTLLQAHTAGQPYVLLYEDDATPCGAPQERLDAILEQHPLPPDCGILALGDINGVSRVRGRETLLLNACAETYTPLVPRRAENKGSHALCVFREAMIPYVQAIIENGVTDLATSRISRYSKLRAYGLFRSPLFLQRRDDAGFRSAELYASNTEAMKADFPAFCRLTRLLLHAPAKRFFIFSNAPDKHLGSLGLCEGDVAVLLNKAVDVHAPELAGVRKVLISRHNVNKHGSWFMPDGLEDCLDDVFEDYLMLSDKELAAERAWFSDYRKATGLFPTTGWIAWLLIREDYPTAEVHLVDFDPQGNIGTFKWKHHAWMREAEDYRTAGVSIIKTRL